MTRNRRWIWLALFAAANLICWAGFAAAVGLIVGDRVDLGVETLIRRGQATAVAFVEEVAERISDPAGTLSTPGPEAGATSPVALTPRPATPPPGSLGTSMPESGAGATPGASATTPTPEPIPTLLSAPLLLADPQISTLTELDAELARSAPRRAVQIRYQEETLNQELATLWHNNPDLPYRDVDVDLKREGVTVSGRVTVLGFEVRGQIAGRVEARNCVPELRIDQVSLAGVLTPGFVRDWVKASVQEAMAWYPPDYPLCLEQIVFEETRATVYGYRR